MNIHDRRTTQKLEKKTVALEKSGAKRPNFSNSTTPFRVDISESGHWARPQLFPSLHEKSISHQP
jgi:hypothetical protein